MWVRFFWPMMVLMVLLLLYLFAVGAFVSTDFGLDLFIDHMRIGTASFTVPSLFFGVYMMVLGVRLRRYHKRLKDRNGLVCFSCDYDLIEGQQICPECGAKWDIEKLNRGWKNGMNWS